MMGHSLASLLESIESIAYKYVLVYYIYKYTHSISVVVVADFLSFFERRIPQISSGRTNA